MKEKFQHSSHTHLQAPQAQAQTKACKRVCLPPPKKNFKIFFPLLLKKVKHPTHKPTMQTADTYGHDNWTTEKEAHAHNKGLAEMAGEVVKQTVVLLINFVLGDSEVLRMPPLRQAPNRQTV
ncbi:MAG: hypothetical protein IT243_07305 [Bacteroidia bacterium]|nr:hypothetical protein [Bacteroidia bacterium]